MRNMKQVLDVRKQLREICLQQQLPIESSRQDTTKIRYSQCLAWLLSADNLCKQFGPRSGPTEFWSRSGSKPFDTVIVFLKEFLLKVNFKLILFFFPKEIWAKFKTGLLKTTEEVCGTTKPMAT